MFTGLVQLTAPIHTIKSHKGGARLGVALPPALLESLALGASVCCSGCCLSVTDKVKNAAYFDVSHESLDKTTISGWQEGMEINIEPSLKLGDELGGHFVFGHVDGIATLENIEKDGDCWRLRIAPPVALLKYIAPKGSVALNGISLTVNEVDDRTFGVNIIPHTWENTNLKHIKQGDMLNIEVDMLARYVERMIGHRL
ncbi:MAG: riboflavin synthase [Alphaproteobacteria bacterium]